MIGFLNAYHFDLVEGSYQEKYEPLLLNYLQKIMPQKTIKTFLVAQNHFPKSIDECEGWIIGGSPKSCYENDPWIKELEKFIQLCHKNKKKLLGICFGHQIIAKALGGKVTKSDKGWGVGVRSFDMIDTSAPWIKNYSQINFSLLFSHQDQVELAPANAKILAQDSFCPFQIFSIENHVFCIQGHPEFTKEYAKERYETRQHLMPKTVYENAINSLELPTHDDIIGTWIAKFFE